MFAREMRVAHRRPEIAVPERLFHVHRVLPLGEPGRAPPVAEVVQRGDGCPWRTLAHSPGARGRALLVAAVVGYLFRESAFQLPHVPSSPARLGNGVECGAWLPKSKTIAR